MFLGCRLRIRSPFLVVGIGNPIFLDFLYKTIMGEPGVLGRGGLEGANHKKKKSEEKSKKKKKKKKK